MIKDKEHGAAERVWRGVSEEQAEGRLSRLGGDDDGRDWQPAKLSEQEVCLLIICVGVSACRQTTGREKHSAR